MWSLLDYGGKCCICLVVYCCNVLESFFFCCNCRYCIVFSWILVGGKLFLVYFYFVRWCKFGIVDMVGCSGVFFFWVILFVFSKFVGVWFWC